MTPTSYPRRAVVRVERQDYPVEVLEESRYDYRVQGVGGARVAWPGRIIPYGCTARVPLRIVRFPGAPR